jgi:hypothetical protein
VNADGPGVVPERSNEIPEPLVAARRGREGLIVEEARVQAR